MTILGSGTSGGVPMIACPCAVCNSIDPHDRRLRCAILIESETTCIVIDCGPDFRQQMLTHKVRKLDAVVFTHAHKDHTAGLDDIRAYNYFQEAPMPVYATPATQESLQKEYYYVFGPVRYPGIPELEMHAMGPEPFRIGDIRLQPIEVKHLNLPVLGFRAGDFTYITDANYIGPEAMEKIKGSRTLVLNALRQEKHLSHFSLPEAEAVAREAGAAETYFTHISHQLGLHAQVSAGLPKGMHLAYDGLLLEAEA